MSNKKRGGLKVNGIASLIQQLVAIACGLVIPKLILNAYGSAVNGLIATITQYISFASIFQGGLTSAVRVSFYKPLAADDSQQVSVVYKTARTYFARFSAFVVFYILIIGLILPSVTKVPFSRLDVFLLVAVIGLSSVFEYLFGMANQLLLFADQKAYVNTLLQAAATLLSAVVSGILITAGCSIILVKLAASAALLLRPLFLNLYVRRNMNIDSTVSSDKSVLSQSNAALVQSIAFYIHSSTDTIVISSLMNVTWVSVYAVHKYAVGSISALVSAVLANTEATFGKLFAERNGDLLKRIERYDLISKWITTVFFGTTIVLINQFVTVYTKGVTDAEYLQPLFATLYILGEMIYCLGLPYHNIIMATGHIKQTQWISTVEAALNIVISVVLVNRFGIIGVAIGTLIAFLFNMLANFVYVQRNILKMSLLFLLKEFLSCVFSVVILKTVFDKVFGLSAANFICFVVNGCIVFVSSLVITALVFGSLFPSMLKKIIHK